MKFIYLTQEWWTWLFSQTVQPANAPIQYQQIVEKYNSSDIQNKKKKVYNVLIYNI